MKKEKSHNNTQADKERDSLKKENGCVSAYDKDLSKERDSKATDELKELKEKAAKYDELWNKYLRACAEFDNARKRWEKEKTEIVKFANYALIKELIVIMDELEHAMTAIKEHSQDKEIQKGIELTYNNLYSILKKEGLAPIEAKGKKFDPHVHEIVGQKEEKELDEHTVIEEVQKGYTLGDRLLRTSKVIISVLPKETENDNKKEDIEKGDNNTINEK